MALFRQPILTARGLALQAKVQADKTKLNTTRIGMGDGNLGGQAIGELNHLISEKVSLSISKKYVDNKTSVFVGGYFTNENLQIGFSWREIGLYALDPDEGEILYCYANAQGSPDYIPGVGAEVYEKYVYIRTEIANADSVSFDSSGSVIFVTEKEFLAHTGDKDRHTSAEEKARLERELAGKATGDHTGAALNSNALGNIDANKFSRIIGTFRRGDDVLDRLLQMAVSGSFEVLSGAINVPDSTKYYTGSIDYVHGGRATIHLSCLIAPFPKYQIDLVDNAWTGWKQLATAEPPQMYDFPYLPAFTAGFAPCTYCKNAFGIVTLFLNIATVNEQNTMTRSVIIGRLPAGFRPIFNIHTIAFARDWNNTNAFVSSMTITPNGDVSISIYGSAAVAHGQISFLAD